MARLAAGDRREALGAGLALALGLLGLAWPVVGLARNALAGSLMAMLPALRIQGDSTTSFRCTTPTRPFVSHQTTSLATPLPQTRALVPHRGLTKHAYGVVTLRKAMTPETSSPQFVALQDLARRISFLTRQLPEDQILELLERFPREYAVIRYLGLQNHHGIMVCTLEQLQVFLATYPTAEKHFRFLDENALSPEQQARWEALRAEYAEAHPGSSLVLIHPLTTKRPPGHDKGPNLALVGEPDHRCLGQFLDSTVSPAKDGTQQAKMKPQGVDLAGKTGYWKPQQCAKEVAPSMLEEVKSKLAQIPSSKDQVFKMNTSAVDAKISLDMLTSLYSALPNSNSSKKLACPPHET